MTFVNIGQAYVLNVHLGIPADEQGTISGDLHFFSELVVLSVLGGRLFDQRMSAGPFMLVGIGNLLVCLFAIIVRSPGR